MITCINLGFASVDNNFLRVKILTITLSAMFNLMLLFFQSSEIACNQFVGKIAAHSAYEMFSWYKYLIVSLVFSHLGFWSGILFLIAPFPDLCLLVLFYLYIIMGDNTLPVYTG